MVAVLCSGNHIPINCDVPLSELHITYSGVDVEHKCQIHCTSELKWIDHHVNKEFIQKESGLQESSNSLFVRTPGLLRAPDDES